MATTSKRHRPQRVAVPGPKRLVPENGHLEIELVGDLAGILAFTNENPAAGLWPGV